MNNKVSQLFPSFFAMLERYAKNIRRATAVQILIVPLFAIFYSFWAVYRMASQIPITRAHTILMWLVPALGICLVYLPSKSLRYSPFWFFRILFFCLAWYVNLSVLSDFEEMYGASSQAEIIAYSDFPAWLVFWIFFFAAYAGLRALLDAAVSKEGRIRNFLLDTGVLWSPFPKTEQKEKRRGALRRSILMTLLFLIALSLTAAGFYLSHHFPNMDIDAVMFTVRFANGNYSTEVRTTVIRIAAGVVLAAVIFFIMTLRRERSVKLKKSSLSRTVAVECRMDQIRTVHRILPVLLLGTAGCIMLANTLNFGTFLYNRIHPSTLYEDHYIAPTPDIIHFPEDRKNLVFIYMESYENTYSSVENGGRQTKDYMAGLTELANDNLYFSNREGRGGQSVFFPTVAYTMASTVAQTGGIPLTTALGNPREELLFTPSYNELLPSLVRLEDILYDAGYNQLFIRGENTTFAGYNTYVGMYPTSSIWDAVSAETNPCIKEKPKSAWGVEDRLLFPVIKEKISALAAEDAPFCVSAYTVDTHSFEHGFRCDNCDPSIEDDFAAAVECSGRIVSGFVHWLEDQPYGDDTVVIIVGDHLADVKADALQWEGGDYVRTTYNCFVHAQKTPVHTNNRIFTTMDMFPTTLSALGVTIDGDRLGLGTDLFSATPTLCEEMGEDTFVEQVQMRSHYYDAHFWQPIDLPRNVYNSHTDN